MHFFPGFFSLLLTKIIDQEKKKSRQAVKHMMEGKKIIAFSSVIRTMCIDGDYSIEKKREKSVKTASLTTRVCKTAKDYR